MRANYNWVQEMNVVALGRARRVRRVHRRRRATPCCARAPIASPASASSGRRSRVGCRTTRASCPQTLQQRVRLARVARLVRQQRAARRPRSCAIACSSSPACSCPATTIRPAGYSRARVTRRAGPAGDRSGRPRRCRRIFASTGSSSIGRHQVDGRISGPRVPARVHQRHLESADHLERARDVDASATRRWSRPGPAATTSATCEDPHPPATSTAAAALRLRHSVSGHRTPTSTSGRTRACRRPTASLTHLTDRLPGTRHEFKAGVEYEVDRRHARSIAIPAGGIYYDYFGEPSELEVWGGHSRPGHHRRAGWCTLQDTWTVNSRLTLSPGVRFEWNRGSVPAQPNVFRTATSRRASALAWDLGREPPHRGARALRPLLRSDLLQPHHGGGLTRRAPSSSTSSVAPDQWVEINRVRPRTTSPSTPTSSTRT